MHDIILLKQLKPRSTDDVFLFYASFNQSLTTREDAIVNGQNLLRRRIMVQLINDPAKTHKVSTAKIWPMFVRHLFDQNILSDCFTDKQNHEIAASIISREINNIMKEVLPRKHAANETRTMQSRIHIRSDRSTHGKRSWVPLRHKFRER